VEPPRGAYWRAIVRHRWAVLTVFLLSVLAGLVWGVLSRPVFSATALLRVDREEPRVLKFEQVVREDGELPQAQLQTFQRLLQSRTLANRVIDLMGLEHHPEFHELRDRRGELTSAFLDRLQVDLLRNARLVKVSFWSHHSDLSAAAANTLVDEFMSQYQGQKVEASRYATSFLSKQQEDARQKLEAAEAQLAEFLRQNDIQFVAADRLREPQALINQQLVILSDSLLKARAERIAKESALNQAPGAEKGGAIPAVLQNPLIAKLKEEEAALARKHRELGQAFKSDYPRMQRLAENIAEIGAQLQEETQKIIGGIRAEYHAALQHETQLQKLVDEQRRLAQKLEGQMVRYNLLRREAEASRELYTALSARLKETQITGSLNTSNISIVDRAEIPLKSAGSGKALKLLLGGLVGLFAGVALAFFLERLDTSIRDAHEVEEILQVPMLGLVPRHAVEARRARELPRNGADGGGHFALVAHEASNSPLAEAFRNVRTSVVYSEQGQPPKTVMVTSLHQDDGGTSVSTNCAISFAQLRAGDVLVIDANMRHPSLHALLGVPGAPGLSDLLTGGADLEDVITPAWQRRSLRPGIERRIPGLYVLPAGAVPFNPVELLASQRFTEVLATLSDRFAHIVIDAPPMFGVSDVGVSDVRVLARQVEGVILVLRHGRASRDAAQHAVRMLAHARVLGVVLNHVDTRVTGRAPYHFPNGTNGSGGK
jgi:polysaccharide biosynthesis transport protein